MLNYYQSLKSSLFIVLIIEGRLYSSGLSRVSRVYRERCRSVVAGRARAVHAGWRRRGSACTEWRGWPVARRCRPPRDSAPRVRRTSSAQPPARQPAPPPPPLQCTTSTMHLLNYHTIADMLPSAECRPATYLHLHPPKYTTQTTNTKYHLSIYVTRMS